MLPSDTMMLYSVINTKLRDTYSSFEELCIAENEDRDYIESKLNSAGFYYNPDINQFR